MPISLTCTCGAKLEIDDAFAGKVIPCPDCQRPLSTVPINLTGAAPPPLTIPDQRTSGWAMASLCLALAGAFTVVGSLIAAGLGWFAIREIEHSDGKLGGRQIARAGLILGIAFSLLTGFLLFLKTPFGIDGFLRMVEWAGKLDHSAAESVTQKTPKHQHPISIVPPHGFGRALLKDPNALKRDDILLYSPSEDAYLVCLAHYPTDDAELRDPTDRLKTALRLLEQSDMVQMTLEHRVPEKGRAVDGRTAPEVPTFYRDASQEGNPPRQFDEDKEETHADTRWGICRFDVPLDKRMRTFLVYYTQVDNMLLVAAGVTRKERFTALRPQLEKALQTILWQK